MNEPLSYETLTTAVVSAGGYVSAAEIQGLTCGHLCAGTRFSREDYVEAVMEWLGREPGDEIVGLYAEMLQQLEDVEMGFELLLPDDDAPLSQRVTELASFCKGFLAGFGLSGRHGDDELSDDLTEVLSDIAEIAQATAGEDDSEENEADLSVIAEHVRVGVLIAFSELGRARAH
ncbi:MAG: hypothetical protein CMD83_17620 [Gammaproteobacteria bacterium]|nr:hypothetical protein [Gammaproteobacteria bacterium]